MGSRAADGRSGVECRVRSGRQHEGEAVSNRKKKPIARWQGSAAAAAGADRGEQCAGSECACVPCACSVRVLVRLLLCTVRSLLATPLAQLNPRRQPSAQHIAASSPLPLQHVRSPRIPAAAGAHFPQMVSNRTAQQHHRPATSQLRGSALGRIARAGNGGALA